MDSPVSTALWGGTDYTPDASDPSIIRELSTASPAMPRVVSIVTSLVVVTEAALGTSGNVSAPQEGGDGVPERAPGGGLQGAMVAAQALVLLSIFLLSSLGNAAVVAVIVKHRRLRTVTNAFIMSLSLSDFLTAILCLPFSFLMLFSRDGAWMFGDAFCVANGFFSTCFGVVSSLTMTLISYDRYYAIVRQPQAKVGRRRASQLLAVVWLAAALVSSPWHLLARGPALGHRRGFCHCMYAFHPGGPGAAAYSVALIVACFLLPFALMCFCHYNICKTVRLSEIRVRPVTTYAYLLRFYSEMRTATTVLIMIVFIIFCWGPYCLMGLAAAIGSYRFHPAVDAAAMWLAWANGAVNPLIYALRNPNISMLLGRSREEGYRTRNMAAHLAGGNPAERIRDRYAGRSANVTARVSSSSPGKTGGEVAMWACKNPAVFFCRDAQQHAAAGSPKVKTADTSL